VSIWLKCSEPAKSSRRTIGVQRSAKTSQATAIGQNWPNPDFMPASVAAGGDATQVHFGN
jgi:hypothetical protein